MGAAAKVKRFTPHAFPLKFPRPRLKRRQIFEFRSDRLPRHMLNRGLRTAKRSEFY